MPRTITKEQRKIYNFTYREKKKQEKKEKETEKETGKERKEPEIREKEKKVQEIREKKQEIRENERKVHFEEQEVPENEGKEPEITEEDIENYIQEQIESRTKETVKPKDESFFFSTVKNASSSIITSTMIASVPILLRLVSMTFSNYTNKTRQSITQSTTSNPQQQDLNAVFSPF